MRFVPFVVSPSPFTFVPFVPFVVSLSPFTFVPFVAFVVSLSSFTFVLFVAFVVNPPFHLRALRGLRGGIAGRSTPRCGVPQYNAWRHRE